MPSTPPKLPEIVKGQPAAAAPVEAIREAVLRNTLTVTAPLKAVVGPGGTALSIDMDIGQWFYTTSPIGGSSITGSGVSSARMQQGHGNARICTTTFDGVTKPVATARDTKIWNGLASPSIAAGMFVYCLFSRNRWTAVLVGC